MSETCLLPGGCPCKRKNCASRGICHECIARHADEKNRWLVACQREKAKRMEDRKRGNEKAACK